jgi:hypothetical protein
MQDRLDPTIDPARYQLIHDAMLAVLPTEGQGLTYDELCESIALKVPSRLFPGGVEGYTTSVKLYLEARGVVRRINGSRLRHLRVA